MKSSSKKCSRKWKWSWMGAPVGIRGASLEREVGTTPWWKRSSSPLSLNWRSTWRQAPPPPAWYVQDRKSVKSQMLMNYSSAPSPQSGWPRMMDAKNYNSRTAGGMWEKLLPQLFKSPNWIVGWWFLWLFVVLSSTVTPTSFSSPFLNLFLF